MKKILKVVGIILLIIVFALIGVASWISIGSSPTYEIISPEFTAIPDSVSLERGSKIVRHVCAACHMGDDGKLSGSLFSTAEGDFGEIWSGNITKEPRYGIGDYTDKELVFLLRTGIKRDGKFAGPYMLKPNLSDEDIASIVEFLRSDDPIVSPSSESHPEPKPSFLAKALEKLGVLKPEAYPVEKINTPSSHNTVEFGKYLATEVYECYNCHSASFETNNAREPEKSAGYFGGGNLIDMPTLGALVSPNITMDMEDGIGKYSEEEFSEMVRHGIRPNDQEMTPLMPKYSTLSDSEIHAIWEYLKTVPIIEKNQAAKI
jgi:mono/diheme cytochrome c family protein